MVDLDKIVVDICREQLPEWNADSTSDPRLELHYTDAHAFLKVLRARASSRVVESSRVRRVRACVV